MADTQDRGSKPKKSSTSRQSGGRRKNVVAAATAGAAIGIGSAALVAALLYANRPKEDELEPVVDPRFEPQDS